MKRSGVSFIHALIGMFALPEILRSLSATDAIGAVPQLTSTESWSKVRAAIRKYWTGALRGSVLGTIIGALPGTGADIAAWISFAVARRFSREPEKWDSGQHESGADRIH